MRTARCTQDNITYTAIAFNQAENFITKKRFLVCPQCEGPAFYRGPTRNGREACFGARPHSEGCTLAAVEHDGTPTGQGDVENEVFTTGQRIVVDFNFGTPVTDLETQPVGGLTDTDNEGTRHGGGNTVREIMSRRMSSLLRALIDSEEFRRSTQIIEIVGQEEYQVADLFVNFADVTENCFGSYQGFWGMVPDARISPNNGALWFNSGGREDLSALLDQRYIGATYQRFHIEDADEIAGAYILVFGELKESARSKRYVPITDPSCFTLG